MSKQMKANNRCRTQRRFNNNNNNCNTSDVISKQAKDLIVAAAAQVLLGQNQTPSALNSVINSCGQTCNNCSIAETIIRATQQPIPQSCHHPVQMKPADTENRNERKLFVGMLSKTMSEQDIKNMFSSYGVIEECSILRDNSGQSKGCAFVTFTSRTSAGNAIKSLNHSTTLEGCTSSLVVKFADTQKDKDQRRGKQSLMQQLWTQTSSPISTSLVTNPYLALAALTSAAQQQQLATTLAIQQQCLTSDFSLASALANPVLMALTGAQQNKLTTQTPSISLSPHFNSSKLDMFSGVRDQFSFTPSLSTTPTLSGVQHLSPSLTSSTNISVNTSKQVEGPEGANLFIYHLPPEFTDNDLISTFTPFGNVISAKVFIDKNSNLSKCFGFVSYDSALSAQSAIQSMHGFQIRNKRLKVQLKKTRDKPY